MKQTRNINKNQKLCDYGNDPLVVNLRQLTMADSNFRTALWTGNNLQLTLMCIEVGEDIGLECHHDTDQFIKIESGSAIVKMGSEKNEMNYCEKVCADYAVIIPAGTWHNIINIGNVPLKVYSIYSPPAHPFGTIHKTKESAQE